MKNRIKMSFGLGAPSVIMVFTILCLTVLGALSLMTASSDYKLAEKNAAYTAACYAADSAAEAWLAEVEDGLAEGRLPQQTTALFPVSDRQSLSVTIEIAGRRLRVLSEKLVVTDTWNYDEYLPQFNDIIIE